MRQVDRHVSGRDCVLPIIHRRCKIRLVNICSGLKVGWLSGDWNMMLCFVLFCSPFEYSAADVASSHAAEPWFQVPGSQFPGSNIHSLLSLLRMWKVWYNVFMELYVYHYALAFTVGAVGVIAFPLYNIAATTPLLPVQCSNMLVATRTYSVQMRTQEQYITHTFIDPVSRIAEYANHKSP